MTLNEEKSKVIVDGMQNTAPCVDVQLISEMMEVMSLIQRLVYYSQGDVKLRVGVRLKTN